MLEIFPSREVVLEYLSRGTTWRQILILLIGLVIAWAAGRLLRRPLENATRPGAISEAPRTAVRSGALVVFPLVLWIWLFVAVVLSRRLELAFDLLRPAMLLTGALVLVRVGVFILRHSLSPGSRLKAWEGTLTAAIWLLLVLHILGWLPTLGQILDEYAIELGKVRLSLLTVARFIFSFAILLFMALGLSHALQWRVMKSPALDGSLKIAVTKLGKFFLLTGAALLLHSFWLLCLGALLFGAQNAVGQYYRFAAADSATPEFKSTAISLVLAGGLVGGILGPSTSRFAVDWLAPKFMGAFLVLIVFALITIVLLRYARIPNPTAEEQAATGRSIAVIAAQPKFIVAVLSGAIGYGVMYFLMTSAPIAMEFCGHPYGDAAFVVAWHVIAMFAPSFLTGALIQRVGVLSVMLAGALINVASISIALAGVAVAQFWWSLVLLGVGWNFLYIGGTTLLTETYRPEEKAKAQGANDFLIFAMMALSSFSSGLIVIAAGWEMVNLSALPMVAVVIVAIAWLARRQRRVVVG